ncbi:hypothetical protein OMF39_15920 [Bordetella pertussis]
MSAPYAPLQPAVVVHDEQGRLYSAAYGDVYHSRDDAAGPADGPLPDAEPRRD